MLATARRSTRPAWCCFTLITSDYLLRPSHSFSVQWTWCVQPITRLLLNDARFVDAASLTKLARVCFDRGRIVRHFWSLGLSSFHHHHACVIERVVSRFAASCARMFGRRPTDTFIDALHERWMAPALVKMRAERAFVVDPAAELDAASERVNADRRADIAAHGVKTCALPSCDKQEATVQQYKLCSACRSVWYCSAEHGALHWKEHKPACRATVAAKEAAVGEKSKV